MKDQSLKVDDSDASNKGKDAALQQTFGWMQLFFELMGILFTLAGLILVVRGIEDTKMFFILLCVLGGMYFLAGRGLQQRNHGSYIAVWCGTVALLPGFPLLTVPAIVILLKLLRPDVRAAFGWNTGKNETSCEQNDKQ